MKAGGLPAACWLRLRPYPNQIRTESESELSPIATAVTQPPHPD